MQTSLPSFASPLLRALGSLLLLAVPVIRSQAQDICARVKIEIQQEVTLERQAFEARMRITNGLTTAPLNDLTVTLTFKDAAGNPVVASTDPNDTNPSVRFFFNPEGSGVPPSVAAGTAQSFAWLIIPTILAGGTTPAGQVYFVGADLTYRIGTSSDVQRVSVTPDFIYVKPLPNLQLDYFLTRDVVGDDPQTPFTIELPEPYTLGVRVKNIGYATAKRLRIESGQPRIVENLQGLAIGFQIIGSEVNNQPGTNSLNVNFGDLPPSAGGQTGVARWIMISTLAGRFVDFSAAVTHDDELGGQLTSLIKPENLHTRFLLHDVRVDLPGRDEVKDFLAFDSETGGVYQNFRVYESSGVDTTVLDHTSGDVSLPGGSGAGVYTFSMPGGPGFGYVRYRDPFTGAKVLTSVVRSDGKVIRPENAWLSRRQNPNTHQFEYFFHLFDGANVTASTYTVTYADPTVGNRAPIIAFIPDKFTKPGQNLGFLVQASDPDGDSVTLSVVNPPAGSTFTPDPNHPAATNIRVFNWAPGTTQTGAFPVTFSVTDGRATSERTVLVSVTSGAIFDSWLARYFGTETNPAIVGQRADPDRDGLPNLLEYALGLDPTKPDGHLGPRIGVDRVGSLDFTTITYEARTDDPTLVFAVMGTDSARNGPWTAVTGAGVPVDQDGVQPGFVRVKMRDNLPLSTTSRPRRFLRLDVSLNPTP
ncbi:MAG: hypothetical protein JSR82_24535 [Verrucomicrobia bacterium]|nr:hypothetical protein [Verrucomicrobiota bacterium]